MKKIILKLENWFTEKYGFKTQYIEAKIHIKTMKAFFVELLEKYVNQINKTYLWIPKSVVITYREIEINDNQKSVVDFID